MCSCPNRADVDAMSDARQEDEGSQSHFRHFAWHVATGNRQRATGRKSSHRADLSSVSEPFWQEKDPTFRFRRLVSAQSCGIGINPSRLPLSCRCRPNRRARLRVPSSQPACLPNTQTQFHAGTRPTPAPQASVSGDKVCGFSSNTSIAGSSFLQVPTDSRMSTWADERYVPSQFHSCFCNCH